MFVHLGFFALLWPSMSVVTSKARETVIVILSPPFAERSRATAVRPRDAPVVERQAPLIVATRPTIPAYVDLPDARVPVADGAHEAGDRKTPLFDQYRLRLEAALSANRRYPQEARRKRQAGTAEVRFMIAADGWVDDVSLAMSSGHARLDREAVNLVSRTAPFPPPPPDIAPLEIILPVTFELPESATS
jgi:protein TonB